MAKSLLLAITLFISIFNCAASAQDSNSAKVLTLLPEPRRVAYLDSSFRPTAGRFILIDSRYKDELFNTALAIQAALAQIGPTMEITAAPGNTPDLFAVSITINSDAVTKPEGYNLSIEPNRIDIVANNPAGAFYAAQTLGQICRLSVTAGSLPCLKITDWPDFANRGIMLDISRDKVPTMKTLLWLVDMFSQWKINQLQLYTEHTFAYRNHRDVWENSSPMTAQEILELDRYCRHRYIQLVPNQNSFGHLYRWLKLPRYRHLAEAPDGSTTMYGFREPATLCPTDPCSIQLISELYGELLSNFTSQFINVGCDETLELGLGRSKELADRAGKGTVYLDFLLIIHDLAAQHGKRIQFWGDIVLLHSELIFRLPSDVTALEWGYESDSPLAEECKKFADAKVSFYVCPGTSGWNSITGRTDNMMTNISAAAKAGLANGAIGLLNTDWGDHGHWHPQPVSFPGYAYGAALSWAYQANHDINLPRVLDLYAFKDDAGIMGKLVCDLGKTYKVTGVEMKNQTILYSLLSRPDRDLTDHRFENFSEDSLTKTLEYIDKTMKPLPQAGPQVPDASRVKGQLICASNMLRHACRLGIARLQTPDRRLESIPQETREKLAAELEQIIAHFKGVWPIFNRPGGLTESTWALEALLEFYRTGKYPGYLPKH